MATITPQVVSNLATAETTQAATANDTIVNATVNTKYRVITSGTATTVTFTSQQNCSQGVLHNVTWGPLPATGTQEFSLAQAPWIISSTGTVAVAHSAITGVTVAAFQ